MSLVSEARVATDDDRWVAEVGTAGDSIVVSKYPGEVTFSIEEPWAGSTETGFGASTSVTLPSADAIALARWILRLAGSEG